nr:synaptobrevin, longin-like domain protein [Tanacetum cinerariifolium]
MVAILEKSKHNADFHPIVDFIEASPLRIETTAEGTQSLATVDGVLRTVTESSLRRNLKLQDEEGINSLPDIELFENLTLMGYNISPNQNFTFQKGFNEFSSNIATALVCLATNRTYNFSKMIFDGLVKNINNKVLKFLIYPRIVPFFDSMIIQQGEGSGTPTDPYHIPSQEVPPSYPTHISSSSIPTVTQSEQTPLSEGEACPTNSGFITDQDRATIAKSSTLPHDTAPRVTSPAAVKGSMQQTINELTALYTSLQSDTEEIRMDEGEVAVERTSEDTEEMATVLTSMDAATVLAGGIDIPTGSDSIPTAGPPVVVIHTGSDVVPTASPIVATATVIARDAEVARIHAEEEIQGMTFEEIKAKFATVWKLVEDFIPMGSKEEAERLMRKGFNLEQEKAKKQNTSEEVPDKEKLSMPCETLSMEISTSILRILHTAKTLGLVWIWLGGEYGNGKGSGTLTEPHHTPSQEAQPSSPTHISSSSIPTVINIPTVIPIPTVTQSEPTPLRQYTRRVRIAQSSSLLPVADEPASPMRDVIKGEACPTDSGFIADQDRATIAKSPPCPMIQHHGRK